MYQLVRTQFVKTDMINCWDFFSSPENLAKITPAYMGFIIRTPLPKKMYEGLMIEYTVKPVMNIPLRWVTEIKTVKDHAFFVDEQRVGPYKMWHHEHHFTQVEGGVEMKDIVSYELPLGILGRIMHAIFIKNKVKQIFDFRYHKVEELFNQK